MATYVGTYVGTYTDVGREIAVGTFTYARPQIPEPSFSAALGVAAELSNLLCVGVLCHSVVGKVDV